MAKFINKKEQVYDLKLTSYGHYLLSVGKFKPTYYAFYDDNVLYDGGYAGMFEKQNEIQNRIKNETQYLESLVLFRDIEKTVEEEKGGIVNLYSQEATALQNTPRKDMFKFDVAIGDAAFNGETQKAPAWKMVMLQGEFSSSALKDEVNETLIPQINISASYIKRVADDRFDFSPDDVRGLLKQTSTFRDGKVIQLVPKDPIFYFEEVNTELLTENFNLEVFEILTGSDGQGSLTTQFQRKYFKQEISQIVNEMLVKEEPTFIPEEELNSGSVEYYFDILFDKDIDREVACQSAERFNKDSYYIDLDFNCDLDAVEETYFDIYGSTTEPEICQ